MNTSLLVRPLLLVLLLLSGCSNWNSLPPETGSRHAVILLYHHVGNDTPAITSVSPQQFAEHLNYLEAHHFQVLPLQKLVQKLISGDGLAQKSIAITFDDGYRSVLEHAVPLLKKRGWPFAVFVNPAAIDRGFGAYMNWDELRAVQAVGGSILNHSMHHEHLVRLKKGESQQQWQQRVKQDIEAARKRLEAEVEKTPKLFAYPYGEFSPALKKLIRQMGYVAFAQQSGAVSSASDPAALQRFPLMGDYAGRKAFTLRLNSRPLPLKVLQGERNVLSNRQRRPQLRLQLGSGQFKTGAVNCFLAGKPMVLKWISREKGIFEIRADRPLSGGRSKYTCTVPATDQAGVYYWYSHLWILPHPDGSWPKE